MKWWEYILTFIAVLLGAYCGNWLYYKMHPGNNPVEKMEQIEYPRSYTI